MSRADRLSRLEAATPEREPFTPERLLSAAEALKRGEAMPRGWADLWSEDQIIRMAELQAGAQ